VIIHLDTSALVDALSGPRRSRDRLVEFIEDGHRITHSTIVLFEWLRGPRERAELIAQEELFPREACVAFGVAEAEVSARLYRSVKRPRGREVDLAIAASAMVHEASLWTLNPDDFRDLPDLPLV
jgi:predicted nucleic acid-binding protein